MVGMVPLGRRWTLLIAVGTVGLFVVPSGTSTYIGSEVSCRMSSLVTIGGFSLAPTVQYHSCYLPSMECTPPLGFTTCHMVQTAYMSGSGLVNAFAGFGALRDPTSGCVGVGECLHEVAVTHSSGSLGSLCQSGHLTEAVEVTLDCRLRIVAYS